MKKIYILLFCFLWAATVQAKMTAEFVPNPVKQGDAVELVLSSDAAFSGVPNIEILRKDFVIGGQQQRQSAQWVNGKGSTIYQLIYTLFPNKSGNIAVQGLKVGKEVLPDLTLSVQADAQYDTKGQITLSVDCPTTAVYPAQRLLCQVYLDDGLGIIDGQIVPPTTEAGTWEQVAPPLPVVGGSKGMNRYQSTFSFTPKQSGALTMDPFVFQGEAQVATSKRNYSNLIDLMFMNIQSRATRPIGAQSQPVTLVVKEKPAAYKGWWLPSPKVTLTESYQMPTIIAVGEPIVRTLALRAEGVLAADMPVPEAPSSNGIKVYANPEQRQNTPQGGEVSVTLTFVPTQNGDVVLPAIQVPWFNTRTEQVEMASVPARSIFVTGAPGGFQEPSSQPPMQPRLVYEESQVPEPTTREVVPAPFPWIYVIGAALLAFVLGIMIAVVVGRRGGDQERKKKKPLPDLYPF